MGVRGVTLTEMIFFGAIASVVLIGAVGLLSRGSRIIEVSRRASGSQVELRTLVEQMSEDVNELVFLEDGEPYDSATAGTDKSVKFVVRSTRVEAGISSASVPTLRRIEYKLGPAKGTSLMRPCLRSIAVLDSSGAATEQSDRELVSNVARLRAWPLAAYPLPDRRFNLVAATDPKARNPGSTVACYVLDVTVGEPATQASVDQTTVTSIVTKLWCRNRVLEIGRGGLN